MRAHGPEPIDDRPQRPIEGQLQLDLRHVDPRGQVVLHLHGPHDADGDGVMDVDGRTAPGRGEGVGVDAQAGKAAVALGQFHDDDGGGEGRGRRGIGGGTHRIIGVGIAHAVVQRVGSPPTDTPTPALSATAKATAEPTPSQRRQDALERHLQLSQIDLEHDDVVGRRLDAVL